MRDGVRILLPPALSSLGDLTVVASAVGRRTLRRPDGFGALQAVAFAAAAVGQRVGASVHHDGVHPVGHGEGLQVALNGDGERQLVYQVHRGAGDNGTAAQILQAEYWTHKHRDRVTTMTTLLFILNQTTH